MNLKHCTLVGAGGEDQHWGLNWVLVEARQVSLRPESSPSSEKARNILQMFTHFLGMALAIFLHKKSDSPRDPRRVYWPWTISPHACRYKTCQRRFYYFFTDSMK